MFRGMSIGEYRSVGEMQEIAPLSKINLFVGPNNSGKSNILRFINENFESLTTGIAAGEIPKLQSHPHAHRGKHTQARLAISVSFESVQKVLNIAAHQITDFVRQLYGKIAPNDILWIDEKWPDATTIQNVKTCGSQAEWHNLWQGISNARGGGLVQHWIPQTLASLRQLIPSPPKVFAIPIDRLAVKENGHQETSKTPYTIVGGKGIILALAELQNPPSHVHDENRSRFENVQQFVRIVTDDSTAQLNVPYKQDEITVQFKGQRFFPLASLGSGIEQVVLHAVAATSITNSIVTFEEPELHLHPVLQRQLMTYLVRTSNQYFISTHSAHLIDAHHANTFHVRLTDGQTIVERALTDAQRYRVCEDLGYRPSDIVQANCVLWVEGPSDRIYLRHWLKQVDPHLNEHVHFSIMFYGGKLLSHLSAGETDTVDDGLDDLIQLRRLNRQIAVVIDSDLAADTDSIRETKRRVRDEIVKNGGLVWISAGREIENYVPPEAMVAAVESVAIGRGQAVKTGKYDKAIPLAKDGGTSSVDKVKVAQEVEKVGIGLEQFDLRERVVELATFIRNANGLAPRN